MAPRSRDPGTGVKPMKRTPDTICAAIREGGAWPVVSVNAHMVVSPNLRGTLEIAAGDGQGSRIPIRFMNPQQTPKGEAAQESP
jgi:hypothetical protein